MAQSTAQSRARKECKSRGVRFADVRDAYEMLRDQERQDREREWQLRQHVWESYAWTDGCHSFWRHGMQRRFPRAFGDGDRTLIPGFDVFAADLVTQYPEFLGQSDDPAELLFDFLATPYRALSTADELYSQAIDLVEASQTQVTPF